VRPVSSEELHPTRGERLEPAEPGEALGVRRVDRVAVRAQGAPHGRERRPRLTGVEGLQDQLGQPIPEPQRQAATRHAGSTNALRAAADALRAVATRTPDARRPA